MTKHFIYLFTFLCLAPISALIAQEEAHTVEHNQEAEPHKEHREKHFISASINHTIIFSAVKDNESRSAISLPSFGVNYTYFFNEKFGLGLHSDIIVEDFVVESDAAQREGNGNEPELEVIERGTPIAVAAVFLYKPLPFLGFLAGAGREFSKHEDFNLIRIGVEAPFNISHHWEVFATVTYDIAIDAYDSLNYGIGIGKMF